MDGYWNLYGEEFSQAIHRTTCWPALAPTSVDAFYHKGVHPAIEVTKQLVKAFHEV
jgi:hypothetical protein